MLINSWKGRLEKLLEKREMLVVTTLAWLPHLLSFISSSLFFIDVLTHLPSLTSPCVLFCVYCKCFSWSDKVVGLFFSPKAEGGGTFFFQASLN